MKHTTDFVFDQGSKTTELLGLFNFGSQGSFLVSLIIQRVAPTHKDLGMFLTIKNTAVWKLAVKKDKHDCERHCSFLNWVFETVNQLESLVVEKCCYYNIHWVEWGNIWFRSDSLSQQPSRGSLSKAAMTIKLTFCQSPKKTTLIFNREFCSRLLASHHGRHGSMSRSLKSYDFCFFAVPQI